MADKKIVSWVTVHGQHVPVYEGETKKDAVSRNNKSKSSSKKSGASGYLKKIDKLNNLKSGKDKSASR